MFRNIKADTASAFIAICTWLFAGTFVYHYLEDWTWNESFYFTVVTLATIGYGDLHPTTGASRLFTALFILSGVAVGLAALGIIGSNVLKRREERLTARRDSK